MAQDTYGRSTRRFKKLAANLRAQRLPCWLCGQEIDYTAPPGDPRGFSVEHVWPRGKYRHLAEDPANLRAAHLGCNDAKGEVVEEPGLGPASTQW